MRNFRPLAGTLPGLCTAALALCVALPAAADSAGVGPSASARQLNFEVYLDDREIGYHRFQLQEEGDALRLTTEADFEVRLLLFTAFEYEHRNVELWSRGCLQRIEARTNSNGHRYAVDGERRGEAFVLQTGDGSRQLADCVGTFAYWDRSLLERPRLLNSQTGEYLEVDLRPLAQDTLRIGDRELRVDRVALKAPGMDIELAYVAGSGEWVALESRVDAGRTLRYRRSPADFMGPAGLSLASRSTGSAGPSQQ